MSGDDLAIRRVTPGPPPYRDGRVGGNGLEGDPLRLPGCGAHRDGHLFCGRGRPSEEV